MKKGLTLLLAVVMLMTAAVANVSAASFADVEGMNCETAVDVLSSLGIVEGKEEGVYAPDDTLTRAEMATIILRLVNMADTATGSDIFTDVPSSHWAYANITAAYQLGIVNGTSETTYNPDDAVTYEQAVKMVVAALGYSVQAETMGGYPTGYLSKAQQLDLLQGVAVGGEMSRGNMAILVYNALDKELFVKEIYGDDAHKYITDENKTLLSSYLKITKITDTITATAMAKVSGNAPARRLLTDEVAVGSLILKRGETNAQDLFGVRSDIYFRKEADSDIPVIMAIVPRSGVEVVDVDAQDIVPGSTTSAVLVYEDENGREEEVSIGNATLVYNGREATRDTAHLIPQIGTVRLIFNGTDCTMIVVESYKNYVVESVLVDDAKVYFKPNIYGVTDMKIDLTDNSIPTVFTDVEGLPIDLPDLAAWDVMSIAESESTTDKVRIIRRSYDMVEGTITEVSNEDVIIGEEVYAVSPSLDPAKITLGQTAAYYLDFTGAVAAVDTSYGVSRSYAWLKSAAYSKGIDGKPQIRVLTQEGEWKVFDFVDRVKYNGSTVNCDAIFAPAPLGTDSWQFHTAPTLMIENSEGKAEVIPQLIAYKTNEEGVITELETAENKTSLFTDDDDKFGGSFSMDFYQDTGRKTRGFNGTKDGVKDDSSYTDYNLEYSGGLVFSRVFANDTDTVLFKIPANIDDEKSYSVGPAVQQGLSLEPYRTWKCISYYDVTEGNRCKAMVMRYDLQEGSGGGTTPSYPGYTVPAGLITKVSTVLNDDGEAVPAIKMINWNGQELSAGISPNLEYCLYKVANSDLNNDPAWYVMMDDPDNPGYKIPTWEVNDARVSYKNGNNRAELFMNVEDLQPGDVVQYELDATGALSMISVVHRGNYSGNLEFAYGTSGLTTSPTTKDTNYRGGNLSVCGTVKKKLEQGGYLIDVNIGSRLGEDTGTDARRILSTAGKFVLWNKDKQMATLVTAEDVVQGDYVWSIWRTTSQMMTVIYR